MGVSWPLSQIQFAETQLADLGPDHRMYEGYAHGTETGWLSHRAASSYAVDFSWGVYGVNLR